MKKRRRVLALLLAATLTFSSFSGIAMAKSETRPANGTTKEQPFGVEQGEVINSLFGIFE